MAEGKSKKHDRNSKACESYQKAMKAEQSKLYGLARHARRYNFPSAKEAPAEWKAAWDRMMALLPNHLIKRVLERARWDGSPKTT